MKRNYKVYKHTSPSNKVYIGITCQEPYRRWQNGKGYSKNKHFTRAIQKYGWDNFNHEVLFDNLTEEEAKLLEQIYIALYDSTNINKGYNITLGGDGTLGFYFNHSEETKQKMSESHKGKNHSDETKDKIRHGNKGKRHTEESKNKMSESRKGKYCKENHPLYGKHHTEESKNKMSESHKGIQSGKNNPRAKSVICVTTKRIFFTAKEGGEYYSLKSKSNVVECCKGNRKSAGKLSDGTKLVWRYLVWNHDKTYRVIKNREVA